MIYTRPRRLTRECYLVEDNKNRLGVITAEARICRCRCGHEWIPRVEGRPGVCPSCKSYNWDKPYVRASKKAAKKKRGA